jgi:hypothetical protein
LIALWLSEWLLAEAFFEGLAFFNLPHVELPSHTIADFVPDLAPQVCRPAGPEGMTHAIVPWLLNKSFILHDPKGRPRGELNLLVLFAAW